MKLISLSANKPSFKTIRFNEQGISLISAIRERLTVPKGTYRIAVQGSSIPSLREIKIALDRT